MRKKINLIGGGFQHAYSSSGWAKPKKIEWVKNIESAPISIYIDGSIMNPKINKDKKNYAWLLESSAIIPNIINWCKNNVEYLENNYELIFTHDERLLKISSKFKLVLPNAVPWVNDVGVHKKSKLISMIASNKTMCDGHIFRQKIIQKYKNKLDHYGRGFKSIEKKEDGLKDYMFSIAMENDNYSNIFCEKITDCFAMGTIPIFWGTPKIGEIFNKDGIIELEKFNIDELSDELYFSKMEAIKENYEIALKLPIAEDYIYENFIK